MSDTDQILRQGIAAFRSGNREQAARVFYKVTQAEPQHQMAWLWLSGCLDDTSEKRECLMRVLNISEDTDAARLARKGLAQLPELDAEQPAVKYPDQPPHAPPVTPQPAQLWESTEHLEPDVVNQTSAAPPQPNHAQQNTSGCSAFSAALLLILVIGICGWFAWDIGTSLTTASPSSPTEDTRTGADITYIAAADNLESAEITYLNAAGREVSTYKATPWVQPYYMSSGTPLRITVTGPEGVGCAIMIEDEAVSEEYGTYVVTCRATVR
jgi:hypothetical protein